MCHMRIPGSIRFRHVIALVVILCILEFLVQAEAKPVFPLMAYRKVRKDEVPSWARPIEIDHARDRGTSEDGQTALVRLYATVGYVSGLFKGGEEEVIGIHAKSHIPLSTIHVFEDLQFDNWRRINWSTIC